MKTPVSVRILLFSFLILILGLVVYSYTQIDLNLTLFSFSSYQYIQHSLIQIGYYQRPLSASLFLILTGGLFTVYISLLRLILKQKISESHIKIFVGISLLCLLAYPAFSHDLFNYMFDARIATYYHLSPYFFKALDFPTDPWIRFMHWTHRYYPYGPGWLLITLIPSWLGMGKFVGTLMLFKVMLGGFYIASTYVIYKILQKIHPTQALFGVTFFTLNPLVIIESLVSGHNEIVMVGFLLISLYWLLSNKIHITAISFLASVSIKFVSLILLPLFMISPKINRKWISTAFLIYGLALMVVVFQRELYGWYLVPLVSLAAMGTKWPQLVMIALSGGVITSYMPYLLFGTYGAQTTLWQYWTMIITSCIYGLLFLVLCKKDLYT